MGEHRRIICPDANESKEKRAEQLFDSISEWVHSKELTALIELFGGNIPGEETSLKKYIDWLENFVKCWDFRAKKQGAERWELEDERFVLEHQKEIFSSAYGLGMTDVCEPLNTPDYILPLGGARLTNLLRPQMAKKMIDQYDWRQVSVVALSGFRPINEIEIPYLEKYAPDAQTEYEAMNRGLEYSFSVLPVWEEEKEKNENIFLSSSVRKYRESYHESYLYSLAAPSSDEKRRANSYDTFKFFLEHFQIEKGTRLLLVTSCIYVPFQLLKFMDLALEGEFEVDCIGVDMELAGNGFSSPGNYLQEIKATVDAMYQLSSKYL